MLLNTYLNLIRQHCPELTEPQLARLAEGLQVKTLVSREAFIATGEVPKYLAFIAKGLLKGVYAIL
ncbi:hypothetical protein BKK51_10720 [Rodentibacter trehalosifermentans]|uniref:Crp/Fnr family transcriptional regulator n=1 Tax=Rodentibacter trehalosifermentans TaxID=1908263 RepID=A0A1V3IY04_9PAST|nr:hypothetical protein [Rodentibacter trehalosifermentans]OOF43856.1 hypothetical protein BKK51_10720 [Rodentibacter trehalosifermentans]OOF47142.1 hypothetical protein BKK52_09845 [Rodentibacter trehalosifermentans]